MVRGLRKQQVILFPSKLQLCLWDLLPRSLLTAGLGCVCSAAHLNGAHRQGTWGWGWSWQDPQGSLPTQEPLRTLRGAGPPVPAGEVTSTATAAVGPRIPAKSLQAKIWVLVSENTHLLEWSSLNSPTQLLHTWQCCCLLLFLFMKKLISKSTTIKDINSTITKGYLVISSAILAKWKKVCVLVFPCWISVAKNAAKFNKTQTAYLVCHIKLQIIYAFKKK